jgi:hypothetical protein
MIATSRFLSWILACAVLVAACGGGGASSPTPTPPDYSAKAAAAKLTSTVNLVTNTVLLSWTDAFPSGASYRIESQNSDGSFSPVETVAGVGGTSTIMQWQRAVTVATVYRVVAVLNSASVTLLTPQGLSTVSAGLPSTPPSIVIDKTEPVTGTVQLSLSGAIPYPSVSWYADLRLIGSATGEGNPLSWNTAGSTNGIHLILAKVQVGPDSYIDVRRSVAVSNSSIALNAVVAGTSGTINVDVTASSSAAISSVSATLDGVSLGSLAAPNACSTGIGCGASKDVYRFTVTPVSGSHSMIVTATDAAGNSRSSTLQVPVINLPGLTLTSPADGSFVSGTLILSGSSSSDRPGVVTVVASLGDYQFMNTSSPSFSGSMDLAGLSAGSYTLTVRATDSVNASSVVKRAVMVPSSPSVAYTSLFSMGARGGLLAVQGDLVLYKADDGSIRLRNVQSGTETLPVNASSIANGSDWQISNGYIHAYGQGADCVLSCIYQWAPDGSVKNLSNPNPYSAAPNIGGGRAYDLHPVARDGYVIWVNDQAGGTGWYTLYDVANGAYTRIAVPLSAQYVGNWNYDFAVQNGVILFYYWAQTGAAGTSSIFDIFLWTSNSQTSTRVTNGGIRNVYPQTDGQKLAWLQSAGGSSGPNTLVSLPLAGGPVSPVSSNANESFQLRDGVLTWQEITSSTRTLKASAQGVASTISSSQSCALFGAGGGYVVFGESGKTYSWNAITRSSTLRLDSLPNQIFVNRNNVYFVLGSTQTVYRMVLSD